MARSAAEFYNAGNAASRAGRYAKAIALYSEAIALNAQFPMAFYNRAIAHSKTGHEDSCVRDLLTTLTLGYDTDEFWATFFGHVTPPLMTELLTADDMPSALVARIRSRTEEYVERCTVFLHAYPQYGMRFSVKSLPARYLLADLIARREDLHPDVFQMIFDLCVDADQVGDDEFAWRAKFLIATVLYEHYQTTEWSPMPSGGGVFFDDDYLMNRPDWGVAQSVLQAAVSARLPARAGEPVQQHLARFTLALARDAVKTLLRRRIAEPPPPRSAAQNWDFAQYVFKLLVGTAVYLDDPAEVIRCITLARRVNAAFAVSSWAVGRHRPGELLAAVTPASDSEEAADSGGFPGTLLIEYFIYETGGDNLIRVGVAPTTTRMSRRYIPPSEVSALVGLGRQWQDPESFAELRDDPGIDIRNLVMNTMAAMTDVPDEAYEDWLDDALFGADILALLADCHRLITVPYNYLHNVPFHLLPEIRRRIDAGQIDEVVVSPSRTLSHQLAARTPVVREAASCLFVGVNSAEVDADAERAAVLGSFRHTDALLDGDATPERVLAAVADFDVIHIACHGEFDVRENTGYLLLTNDERLYPADLALAPGLCADLVFLNACISGVSPREARNGDQSLGLPNALLYGGARQVIGTLWQVDADAAVEFASTFYRDWRNHAGSTASIVLRTQQLMRERFTDMFAWGAHAVFGDWR